MMQGRNARPVMQEYSNTSNVQENRPQENQQSRPDPNIQSSMQRNTTNTPNTTSRQNIQNTTTTTTQSTKSNKKEYKINPDVIPRPNFNEEIYKNDEKMPIYNTNETSTPPPHSNTHFLVNETQNSSCRFIRSSLNKIPCDQAKINSSNLNFGKSIIN